MELTINDRIRNRRVDYFNSFNISLRFDSLASTFSFDFFYDPDVIEQKEMACVGHYHLCKLTHNGELLLTGQILSERFSDKPIRQLVPIGGYSLPGILMDCQIPTNDAIDKAVANGNLKLAPGLPAKPYAYPLQTDGLSLRQIAEKLIAPFNLSMVVDPSVSAKMDEPFEESSAKPRDTVGRYLIELAGQKNITLSHNEFGQLLFTSIPPYIKPVMEFNVPKGGLPGVAMDLHFNGQTMHSQITVMKQAGVDEDNAGEFTVTNPYVPFVFRPRTIIQSSGTDIDTELAAKNALADELRGLAVTVQIDRWDINNKVIKPKSTITIINPDIYIFKKTDFFIESVDYKGNEKEMTATLHCVLKSCYDLTDPKYIFAGINLH